MFIDGDEKFIEISRIHCQMMGNNPDQILLDLISKLHVNMDGFNSRLREIKDLFIKREFASIFTNDQLLPVYAVEYLPGRSLCYRDVFLKIPSLRELIAKGGQVFSIGAGNGAELLAVASGMIDTKTQLNMTILDIADYKVIPQLIAHANDTFKLNQRLSVDLKIGDLLDKASLLDSLEPAKTAHLITACFILNEILNSSKSNFAYLLTALIPMISKNSFFLVIDSAGSFSEFKLGENENSFKLFKLLDAIKSLKVIESFDSVWYRYNQQLNYPDKINNMRFFLRIYQKL
jgi:25S rRNA (uracil2843-N3)-methyltransferase